MTSVQYICLVLTKLIETDLIDEVLLEDHCCTISKGLGDIGKMCARWRIKMAARSLSVNELLCYFSNKYGKCDNKKLNNIISDFFLPSVISEAKDLLVRDVEALNLVDKWPRPTRRRDSDLGARALKDIQDITAIWAYIDSLGLHRSLPIMSLPMWMLFLTQGLKMVTSVPYSVSWTRLRKPLVTSRNPWTTSELRTRTSANRWVQFRSLHSTVNPVCSALTTLKEIYPLQLVLPPILNNLAPQKMMTGSIESAAVAERGLGKPRNSLLIRINWFLPPCLTFLWPSRIVTLLSPMGIFNRHRWRQWERGWQKSLAAPRLPMGLSPYELSKKFLS